MVPAPLSWILPGLDNVYSGHCGLWDEGQTGTEDIQIPHDFSVRLGGFKQYTTTIHHTDCDLNGNVVISKCGASDGCEVSSETIIPNPKW